MSSNFSSREEAAVNQLYATMKAKFEQDGVLREIRCLLQSKMIAMMKNKNDPNSLLQRSHTSSLGDGRMKLLDELIMEYLHWHGFHYTAEMFSMESSCENIPPMRQCLERIFGKFGNKDLPILLELIATAWKNKTTTHFSE